MREREKERERREVSLKEYKKQAVKAAKDLRYGDGVVRMIDNSKTEREIDRIMTNARKGLIK